MSDDDPVISNMQVSGGAGSAAANMDDLLTLASLHQGLAGELSGLASRVGGVAADGDLWAAAVFDPAGVMAVRGMLETALTGRIGLHTMSDVLADKAGQVQAVHDYTVSSDETQAAIMDGVMWGLGRSQLAIPGMVLDIGLQSAWDEISGLFTGDEDPPTILEDPEAWLLAHPGFINRWGESLPGIFGFPPNFQTTAGLIASRWPDGDPRLTETTDDPDTDQSTFAAHAPEGLGDLMRNLAARNGEATKGHDEIDVQTIMQPDGSTAYIVNIPGTKDLSLPGWPGAEGTFANDMLTNLYGVAGLQTSREEAIAMALHEAGATTTDPVMLVGHSQGGIVAAQAAADTANGSFNYNVTHVVTAASPVALADIPDDVQVLSLEGNNDLIPQTDAADNPSTANHTTVTFDYDTGNMGGNHALERSYQEAADTLDEQLATASHGLGGVVNGSGANSASPSVSTFVDSASDFFADESGGTQVGTQTFVIERVFR